MLTPRTRSMVLDLSIRWRRLQMLVLLTAGAYAGCLSTSMATRSDSSPPESPEATETPSPLDRARDALRAGQLDEAAEQLDDVSDESETVARLRARIARDRGREARRAGETERAFEQYHRAAALDPRPYHAAHAWLQTVELGEQLGRPAEQLAPFAERASEADPTSVEARRLAARLWDEADRPERALDFYRWLWEADPGRHKIGTRLAALYRDLDRYERARKVYERVLESHPDSVQAALNLADLSVQLDDHERARSLYRDLLDRHPNHPGILRRFARFLRRQGETERAATLETRARQHMPGVERREMRELE